MCGDCLSTYGREDLLFTTFRDERNPDFRIEVLVGIFKFLSKLDQKNLTLYSLEMIRKGRLAFNAAPGGGLSNAVTVLVQ